MCADINPVVPLRNAFGSFSSVGECDIPVALPVQLAGS